MKKFYSFLFAAVALVGFAACNSDNTEEPAPAGVEKVSFTANIENTKTDLDGLQTIWCKGDVVMIEGFEFVTKDGVEFTCTQTGCMSLLNKTVTAVYSYNKDGKIDSAAGVHGALLTATSTLSAMGGEFNFAVQNAFLKFTTTGTVTLKGAGLFSTGDELEIQGENAETVYVAINPAENVAFSYEVNGIVGKSTTITFEKKMIYNLGVLDVTVPPAVIRINNMNGWGDLAITVKSGETTLVNAQAMTKEGDTNIYKYELDAEHVGKEVTYYITHSWYQTSTKTITLADTCEPINLNTTYLQPNSDGTYWGQGGAWFAAYFFGDGDGWVKAQQVKDNFYEVEIPTDKNYTNIIFCRMKNTDTTTLAFSNSWNQTSDLTIKHMCYCVNSWEQNNLTDSRWY